MLLEPAAPNAARLPLAPAPAVDDDRRRVVAEIIQRLHGQAGGLSRVHHTHPALYAKARRAFGSWREAVAAAGLDYVRERRDSLRRGLSLRDQRRAAWRALALFLAASPGAQDDLLLRTRPELARRVRRLWGSIVAAQSWAERNRDRAHALLPVPLA
jgi:hypothetical protein